MKILVAHARRKLLPISVAMAIGAIHSVTYAQDDVESNLAQQMSSQMEEVFVQGRLIDSAQSLVLERIEQPYSAEILGFEEIARIGDPDIASALRRVTGLSLVDGKYIYVRGLGERYSSTTMNGAIVPSPELTRTVIPLDLFPTSILESVKVYKSYSPDQPAAFGGGNIDIRTKGIPDSFVFNISVGTGYDSNSSDDGLEPVGDGGDLPSAILTALSTYQGNLQPNNIVNYINTDGGTPSAAERAQAEAINRDLMLTLDRNIDIKEQSLDPDLGGSLTIGNNWFLNDDITFGAVLNLDTDKKVRNQNRSDFQWSDPEINLSKTQRTTETETFTGALNLGVDYIEQHSINTNSYVIENDKDTASISTGHDPDFLRADGRERLQYFTRLEKQELAIHQIAGNHNFVDGDFGFVSLPNFVSEVNIEWIYSDSEVTTSFPNSSSVQASNTIDPATGALLTSAINVGSSSQFNFLELEDQVESGGFRTEALLEVGNTLATVYGGYLDTTKARQYFGYTANIVSEPLSPRFGTPGEVLSDSNLTAPDSGFSLDIGSNFGTESYLAAQTIEAIYGGIDLNFNDQWKMSAGARWEDFKQVVPVLDLLDMDGTVERLIEELQDPDQSIARQNDDIYYAFSMTYISDGFLDSDNFQVRFGYGSTVVRPDLRETADVQYFNIEENRREQGNPNLISSAVDHYEVRAELFYGDGSNYTASLFYKDISNPIETVRAPSSDTVDLLTYANADQGSIYGLEVEALKELGAGFFISGNVVLSDSELEFGSSSNQTSSDRRLTGHSEYVVNAQLGFDSDDGMHSVSTAYNVYGERIFFGGLSPEPDSYEQPFHSLDLLYSFYPTENATVSLKLKNILGEDQTFEQNGTTTIEREIGTSLGLDFKYSF